MYEIRTMTKTEVINKYLSHILLILINFYQVARGRVQCKTLP